MLIKHLLKTFSLLTFLRLITELISSISCSVAACIHDFHSSAEQILAKSQAELIHRLNHTRTLIDRYFCGSLHNEFAIYYSNILIDIYII